MSICNDRAAYMVSGASAIMALSLIIDKMVVQTWEGWVVTTLALYIVMRAWFSIGGNQMDANEQEKSQ